MTKQSQTSLTSADPECYTLVSNLAIVSLHLKLVKTWKLVDAKIRENIINHSKPYPLNTILDNIFGIFVYFRCYLKTTLRLEANHFS